MRKQPPGSLGMAAGGCPGGIKRLSGRVAGLQPCKNSRRRDFNLERVGFLGRTRPRSRPRTHDDPPAQPLPRRESPPPVRHAAETNFQDEADTWWVRAWGGVRRPDQAHHRRAGLVEVVLLDSKANPRRSDASTGVRTHNAFAVVPPWVCVHRSL